MGFLQGKVEKISASKTETIGIIGAGQGYGTTHLALTLAAFLCQGLNKRVACVELNQSGTFADLEQAVTGSESRTQAFIFCGVNYVKGGTAAEFVQMANRDYDYVIADMGREYERVRMDFLRCQRKLAAVAFNPWQEASFEHFMECAMFEDGYREWRYCYSFGQEAVAKRLERRFQIPLFRIPFREDVMRLTGRELDFCRTLLSGGIKRS